MVFAVTSEMVYLHFSGKAVFPHSIRVDSGTFVAGRCKGGTGIRTQGNGFANRGLSPLGDAAINYLR